MSVVANTIVGEPDAPKLVLNFGHPLTLVQTNQLEAMIGTFEVRTVPVQVDRSRPITEIAAALLAATKLTPGELIAYHLLVVLPGLADVAVGIVLALYGVSGSYPDIVTIRPVAGGLTPQFQVGEIVDLYAVHKAGYDMQSEVA